MEYIVEQGGSKLAADDFWDLRETSSREHSDTPFLIAENQNFTIGTRALPAAQIVPLDDFELAVKGLTRGEKGQ